MSKNKSSWLCLIKSFFFSQPDHRQQQRSKRRRIWLFGRLKRTKGLPSPPPPPLPPPLLPVEKVEENEKQSKCEDEQVSKPTLEFMGQVLKSPERIITVQTNGLGNEGHKDVENWAAIKVQTAYRGYLARKALRALKGFVRLQAIIRGRAVRRQAMTTFKCLQAIVNIQSEVCNKRGQMAQGKYTHLHLHGHHDDNLKAEINMYRRLDGRLLQKKEEIDSIMEKRIEANSKTQRSKAHYFNHRISSDSEGRKSEGRLRYWLEQYVNDQIISNKEQHLELKKRECSLNKLSLHRRSFQAQRKHGCSESTGQNPRSPISIPTYMAATESAKAKARSTSTPRLRPVVVDRAYSDGDSPCKHKLVSPMSSTRSEITCSGFSRVSNRSSCSQQRHPSFKGLRS